MRDKRLRIKNLYIRYCSFLRTDFSNFRRGSRTWEPHFRHCSRTSMPIYMISKSFPPQGCAFFISTVSPTAKETERASTAYFPSIRSQPMYGLSTSGTVTLPSSFW